MANSWSEINVFCALRMYRRSSSWPLLPQGHGRPRSVATAPPRPRPVVWPSRTPAYWPASPGRIGRQASNVVDDCRGSGRQYGNVPLVWLAKLGCCVPVVVIAMCRCPVRRRSQLSCHYASPISRRSRRLATESITCCSFPPRRSCCMCRVCRQTSHSACSLRCSVTAATVLSQFCQRTTLPPPRRSRFIRRLSVCLSVYLSVCNFM